jgi:hypothetical protein
MASSTRSVREEERRLHMRTLVIASVASATAAAVTSQLWIHGTWIAAALTPALVALISEAMHRPTERIARAWTSDRPALGAGASRHADDPAPADQPLASGSLPAGPVRVYRQPSARSQQRRRRLALGVVAATAVIAFVIGIAVLTAADLVSGGSIGKGAARTTLLGGSGKKKQQEQQEAAPEQAAPKQTPTTEEPPPTEEPAPEQPPSDTAPVVPPETPPGEPTPDTAPTP